MKNVILKIKYEGLAKMVSIISVLFIVIFSASIPVGLFESIWYIDKSIISFSYRLIAAFFALILVALFCFCVRDVFSHRLLFASIYGGILLGSIFVVIWMELQDDK